MYNEGWDEFQKTMIGVLQGLIDLYFDQLKQNSTLSWDAFISRYVIVLLADGYKNLKTDFKARATELGIFDESVMLPFVKKIEFSSTYREDLKNMFEIKELIKIKLETEDQSQGPYVQKPIMNLIHTFQSKIRLGEFVMEHEAKDLANF